jgi:hypothetical protein
MVPAVLTRALAAKSTVTGEADQSDVVELGAIGDLAPNRIVVQAHAADNPTVPTFVLRLNPAGH